MYYPWQARHTVDEEHSTQWLRVSLQGIHVPLLLKKYYIEHRRHWFSFLQTRHPSIREHRWHDTPVR